MGTKQELHALNELPRMREWLEDVGLTDVQQEMLFDALDDGNGRISYSTFLVALVRMSCPVQSADAVVRLYEVRKIRNLLRNMNQKSMNSPRAPSYSSHIFGHADGLAARPKASL